MYHRYSEEQLNERGISGDKKSPTCELFNRIGVRRELINPKCPYVIFIAHLLSYSRCYNGTSQPWTARLGPYVGYCPYERVTQSLATVICK